MKFEIDNSLIFNLEVDVLNVFLNDENSAYNNIINEYKNIIYDRPCSNIDIFNITNSLNVKDEHKSGKPCDIT